MSEMKKKVLVETTILDNFIEAKKSVDLWRKSLADAQKGGKHTKEQLQEIAIGLANANQ